MSLLKWFSKLLRPAPLRRQRSRGNAANAAIELMEQRTLLSGGTLDLSFGGGDGISTVDISGDDYAHDLVRFPDSEDFLLVGTSGTQVYHQNIGDVTTNGGRFSLARFNENGSLDSSFGRGGKVSVSFSGNDIARAAEFVRVNDSADPWRILVAGTVAGNDFGLARFHVDGRLDTSYGTNGLVRHDLGGTDWVGDMTTAFGGGVIVVGSSGNDFAVARFDEAGNRAAGFGNNGVITRNLGSGSRATSVLAGTSTIYVGGMANGRSDLGLLTLRSDGSIVNEVRKNVSGVDFIQDLEFSRVRGTVRVWAAGRAGSGDFTLAAFDYRGRSVNSFGVNGAVITNFSGSNEYAAGIEVLPDGRILAAGTGGQDFAMVLYNTDGSIDQSFGGIHTGGGVIPGRVRTNISGIDIASDLEVLSDGSILLAGAAQVPNGDFALAKYTAPDSGDLVATSFDVVPGHEGIRPGASVGVIYSVQNIGQRPMPANTNAVGLLQVTSGTIIPVRRNVGSDSIIRDLPPGEVQTVSTTIVLPDVTDTEFWGTDPAELLLSLKIDSAELNTANNQNRGAAIDRQSVATSGSANVPVPAQTRLYRTRGGSDLRPAIGWDEVRFAETYDLWINNRTTGQSAVIRKPDLTGTRFVAGTDLNPGSYRAWIRAANSSGMGPWSEAYEFRVGDPVPGRVTLRQLSNAGSVRPVLRWNPVNYADVYDLWIDNRTTGERQIIRRQNLTSTSFTPDQNLTPGQYRMWVRAANESGFGVWSHAVEFSAGNTKPGRVVLARSHVSRDAVTLNWATVAAAATYEIWINNLTTGESGVILEQNIRTTHFTSPGKLPDGSYRAWARAVNGTVKGDWSEAWDFAVGDPRPEKVQLTPPANEATARPEIRWQAETHATSYTVWINNQTTGKSGIIVANDVRATSFVPQDDLASGIYRVWVRARNLSGAGPWSAPLDFAAGAMAPATVTNLTPAGTVGTRRPTIEWPRAIGAQSYEIQINRTGGDRERITRTTTINTSFTPDRDLEDGGYTVWVRAANAHGFGRWSRAFELEVAARPGRRTSALDSLFAGDVALDTSLFS